MITAKQYFGQKPYSEFQKRSAEYLLSVVNRLIDEAAEAGIEKEIDPDTGTQISGSKGGSGDGGFRSPDSKTGSPNSSHKQAKGIDIYDPHGKLDDWLSSFDYDGGYGNDMLELHNLYRESPNATPGWTHLTTRPPGSKRRTFTP